MTINLKKSLPNIMKILVMMLIIFTLTIVNNKDIEETILTSSQGLSNKKLDGE